MSIDQSDEGKISMEGPFSFFQVNQVDNHNYPSHQTLEKKKSPNQKRNFQVTKCKNYQLKIELKRISLLSGIQRSKTPSEL